MRYFFPLALLACLTACAPVALGPTPTPLAAEVTLQQALADYRGWVLLTPEPKTVGFWISILCYAPFGPDLAFVESEHGVRDLKIYVNPTGAAAMLQPGAREFPVGSIIVKEKFPHQSDTVEAWGLMLKDVAGHWVYAYQAVDGPLYQGDETLPQCHACHAADQLPPEVVSEYEQNRWHVPTQARDEVFFTPPKP